MLQILFLIDALNAGGAENVAVNLANELVVKNYEVSLCATRRGGPLQTGISPLVNYFCLNRSSRFDLFAAIRLAQFTRQQQVQIIHAHSSSLFIASLVKLFVPKIKLIWHDHFGAFAIQTRSTPLYRLFVQFADGVIAVNKTLADWSVNSLRVPPEKVWNLPNFVQKKEVHPLTNLPGQPGCRLVCVANLRPQKDHLTLVRAMKLVVEGEPLAHLILVGADNVPKVKENVWSEISYSGLKNQITWLGSRDDVQNILAGCDIGVLSSTSEGLPLALLDYGTAGLAVVATDVGECAEVLDHGVTGCLVPPRSPQDLANGILYFLGNPTVRIETGKNFQERVKILYSAATVIPRLEEIYQQVLGLNEE